MVTSHLYNDLKEDELWKLESLGIQNPAENKCKIEKEEEAKIHFLETVCREEDGRYTVSLSWVDRVQVIPDNRSVARKRLVAITDKLIRAGKFKEYDDIFVAWEKEDIIEVVRDPEKDELCHYLPHRPVFKPESSTTPVRPVYDASCKSNRAPSLIDCLEKGPNLLDRIPAMFLRFREGKIGVTSDIRKAFLMIQINKEKRNFLRFLWWDDVTQKPIKVYRHKRVVFGINCSPFLLAAVVEHHLSHVGPENKEVAQQLLRSMYVDNCVTSVNSEEEYDNFRVQATRLMAAAQMELRQWERSLGKVSRVGQLTSGWCGLYAGGSDSQQNYVTNVLGLEWNKLNDTLLPHTNKSNGFTREDD